MTRSHKRIENPKNKADRRLLTLLSPKVREQARAEIRANLSHGAPFAVGYCACGLKLSTADNGECGECADERELFL